MKKMASYEGNAMDFLKLLFPLFMSGTDYELVRQKLGAFAFYQIWFATWVVRKFSPAADLLFSQMETRGIPSAAAKSIPWIAEINLAGLFIALIGALIFYISHLHDRVSDAFGIRKRFDKNNIIVPLATLVGAPLNAVKESALNDLHDRYMRRVFYKYTSSKADKPLVDKHDIGQALDAWSWFWVGVEGAVIWSITAILGLFLDATIFTISVLMIAVFLVLSYLRYPGLIRRAQAQIESIADDPTAKLEVKKAFDEI